ncbi:GNAT family N-acetyltransferase [Pseudidiomarina aestuarii]|uniref:GNAT family N-acetyltransferase n=1 Tax=Pseudidiomarina aestuarii TaxID=624146 RepID=A0A7Z7ET83_9GAMM|nr:GNAT family N-acetyltransferase [Pseudidiomarina aestuarii]RUO40792.1 GNAT family N-acetyltransferase [Pseudidiomarina aestuarii]
MSIKIDIGTLADIVAICAQIPEFDRETTLERLKARMEGAVHLILVAKIDDAIVGYKVGYQLTNETFYSWIGGVIPTHRKLGIATLLLKHQEQWAIDAGYKQIKVKSMNRYPQMLKMLISNGYEIIGVEGGTDTTERKIVFSKSLGDKCA